MRHGRWTAGALAAAVVLLLSGLVTEPLAGAQEAPAAPDPAAGSTPERLDAAVAAGELDQATADLLLAQALGSRPLAREVPSEYTGTEPWDGTIPLLQLQERLAAMPDGPVRREIVETLGTADCGSSSATLPSEITSAHFYVEHGTVAAGLTANDYVVALEASRSIQIDDFGWAAPPSYPPNPAPGGRYHVRIDDLEESLYGYVNSVGTHGGTVGDNPATPWNEGDALASCMVLNDDFGPFEGTPAQAMQATVAHEYHHSIQFGLGAVSGANAPDLVFIEGGATWMEDEVFDAADDNHHYLWPAFHEGMAGHGGSWYAYWVVFRGLTERFGTNVAGGGEDVWQRFWELVSQGSSGSDLDTLNAALGTRGLNLRDAFHDQAIASAFVRSCGGGYTLPHCYEEADAYVANAGLPAASGTIASVGGSTNGTLEDGYSARWFAIPAGGLRLTLTNTSAGGELRATAVCDTGTTLVRRALPTTVGAGASTALPWFDGTACVRRLVVVTNQAPPTDDFAPARTFTIASAAASPPTIAPPADFDGNGRTDRSVFRPTTRRWYIEGVPGSTAFGVSGDIPVPADYDGFAGADIAVFRPSNGRWYIDGIAGSTALGRSGDVPVPGDYDGDGAADIAVFRPSTGRWYIDGVAGSTAFGIAGDVPVPGQYDGDPATDIAVFRPSTGRWYIDGIPGSIAFGLSGDVPVPGDYDDDGTTERAVFRRSSGRWYLEGTPGSIAFGVPGDLPVPGQYDADPQTDLAVFRSPTGRWFVNGGVTGVTFGLAGDFPLPFPHARLSAYDA